MSHQIYVSAVVFALCLSACASLGGGGRSSSTAGGADSVVGLRDSILRDSSLRTGTLSALDTLQGLADSDSLPDSLQALGAGLDTLGLDSLSTTGGDSLRARSSADSLRADSLAQQTKLENNRLAGFDDIIEYRAKDSIVMIGTNMAYLFGSSTVDYKDKGLEANYMRMNMDSNLVFAHYVLDSAGNATAHPKFKDGGQTYEAKSMSYNFKTSKGYITGVVTEQGEGYVTAERTKKDSDDCMYMEGGRYTTCSNHDHPHFYLRLTRAKVRPGKNIVAGPSYLVIGDVPLPIGLPFGFFPFSSTYASGILMPSYGEESGRGLYLREGGYYFAINDYVDFSVTGDWYSKGSWGLRAHSNYRKRYRYNGTFDVSYLKNVLGDKDVAGSYTSSTDFRIVWSHSQDAKANPNQTFSASVNYSSSSYNHNSLNTLYNPLVAGQDTKSSSINYTRTFAGTPFRLSASIDATQTSRDSTVTMSLPNLSISMNRIYPFKRKERVGAERWYEKISLSYSGQLRNSITTKEDSLFRKSLIKDWRNGMSHNIPISASYKLLDYIDLTLSANYNERWYTHKVRRSMDHLGQLQRDTVYGFNRVSDFSASANLSTTVYGFFRPWKIFGDKVQMIRHRMTPRLGVTYSPDFGAKRWGIYDSYTHTDASTGKSIETMYSLYEGQLFGAPSPGKTGAITFSLDNNLEAKLRGKPDSTGGPTFKKISLIDNFSLSTSYNMAADSFQLSDISARIAVKLSKSLTINLSGNFDPYMYGHTLSSTGQVQVHRIDKLRILNGKGFGSLRSTGTSFSYTFNNQTFSKLKKLLGGGDDQSSKNESKGEGDSPTGPPADEIGHPGSRPNASSGGSLYGNNDDVEHDADGYVQNALPWSFTVNYGVTVNRTTFDTQRNEYNYGLTHSLMFSGQIQPTKNWSFNFNASYDFLAKKLAGFTVGITRDLHCWSLTANAIPVGPYKSYNFTVGVKSSLLKDIKYEKHNHPTQTAWY